MINKNNLKVRMYLTYSLNIERFGYSTKASIYEKVPNSPYSPYEEFHSPYDLFRRLSNGDSVFIVKLVSPKISGIYPFINEKDARIFMKENHRQYTKGYFSDEKIEVFPVNESIQFQMGDDKYYVGFYKIDP